MDIQERFKSLTKKARNIVISTHIYPDADGIGSQVALCMALNSMGKTAICVTEEPLLYRYHYLDPKSIAVSYTDYIKKHADDVIDLFIVVDTNSLDRVGKEMRRIAAKASKILFIDHHPCSEDVMNEHCIDVKMAATGELVGNLIESVGVKLTKELALPLYTSILIDTSSFRYPTVSGNTHRLVAKLLDAGVTPPYAYNKIYGTKPLSYIHLLGAILSSARQNQSGTIAWFTLRESDMAKFQIEPEDTHAIINHLLILDHLKIACMFREQGDQVKVSMRAVGDIDVGNVAKNLGGGGHHHSAAAIINGGIDAVVKNTVLTLEAFLKENP